MPDEEPEDDDREEEELELLELVELPPASDVPLPCPHSDSRLKIVPFAAST